MLTDADIAAFEYAIVAAGMTAAEAVGVLLTHKTARTRRRCGAADAVLNYMKQELLPVTAKDLVAFHVVKNMNTANWILARLCSDGKITRIKRGEYEIKEQE